MKTDNEILDQMIEDFSQPFSWCQNSYGEVNGARCLIGEMNYVITNGEGVFLSSYKNELRRVQVERVRIRITAAIRKLRFKQSYSIVAFNDYKGRTREQVVRVLIKAREME